MIPETDVGEADRLVALVLALLGVSEDGEQHRADSGGERP